VRWSVLRHSIGRAARVAALTTILIGVVYATVVAVFDEVDAHHLVSEVDAHLKDRLAEASHRASPLSDNRIAYTASEIEGAPVLLWRATLNGQIVTRTPGAPQLTIRASTAGSQPFSVKIGNTSFRLQAIRVNGGYLVAGQSLPETAHVENVLLAAELIAGPVLLVGTYLGTLVIGLTTSGPVEQSRRRQLEFTADASHELRTPLAVIQAEVGLALNTSRDEHQYCETLTKVGRESERLRHIVDDLLWLARFDSYRPSSDSEPVDLSTIAESCRDRFGAIAQARAIKISVENEGGSPALIDAPPDLIDRLTGVLVDNACCYAGHGGVVRIVTSASVNSVSLSVDDSGPGIPEEDRPRLFDRFHRATEDGNGTGLGLAIADSVVRSTSGRWKISDSALGGARMEVSWRRSHLSGSGGLHLPERWTRPVTRFNHRSTPIDDPQVPVSNVGSGGPR
jgi:signal transduction histidine kinase